MDYSIDLEFFAVYDVITDDKQRYRIMVPSDVEKAGEHAEYIRRKVNQIRREHV